MQEVLHSIDGLFQFVELVGEGGHVLEIAQTEQKVLFALVQSLDPGLDVELKDAEELEGVVVHVSQVQVPLQDLLRVLDQAGSGGIQFGQYLLEPGLVGYHAVIVPATISRGDAVAMATPHGDPGKRALEPMRNTKDRWETAAHLTW